MDLDGVQAVVANGQVVGGRVTPDRTLVVECRWPRDVPFPPNGTRATIELKLAQDGGARYTVDTWDRTAALDDSVEEARGAAATARAIERTRRG